MFYSHTAIKEYRTDIKSIPQVSEASRKLDNSKANWPENAQNPEFRKRAAKGKGKQTQNRYGNQPGDPTSERGGMGTEEKKDGTDTEDIYILSDSSSISN